MTSDDVPSSPTLAADPTSWRAGLRKTGSTGTVPDVVASADKATGVQKSASTSVVINVSAYFPLSVPSATSFLVQSYCPGVYVTYITTP